jgi:RHS repeat-associated protein
MNYTFTGQFSYMDDPTTTGTTEGFGLMFYNARWYDPYLSHFTQPDIIVPEQSQGVQAWDRYAYSNNNPIINADPSGHCIWDGCIVEAMAVAAVVGAAIGYGTQVYNNYQDGYTGLDAWTQNIDAQPIVTDALVGAAAVVMAPVVVAAASDVLAGTALATGSTALMEASVATAGTAAAVSNFLYGGAATASETTSASFVSDMEPEEAERYNSYWENSTERHAPIQSSPFDAYNRYDQNGNLHQVTTYDEYGRRGYQYDLTDSRWGEHYHTFEPYDDATPNGVRSTEKFWK